MSDEWQKECSFLRHANKLLREGHEQAKHSEYERGRRDMMREVLHFLRDRNPTTLQVSEEELLYCWPKETR